MGSRSCHHRRRNSNMMMVCLVFALLSLVSSGPELGFLNDAPAAPEHLLAKRSTSCNTELTVTGRGYGEFCHPKTKKCEHEYRACKISTEQRTCLAIDVMAKLIETAACEKFTTNPETQTNCHCGFKTAEKTAELACSISLTYMCDVELCPQNLYDSVCKGHKTKGISAFQTDFDCGPKN